MIKKRFKIFSYRARLVFTLGSSLVCSPLSAAPSWVTMLSQDELKPLLPVLAFELCAAELKEKIKTEPDFYALQAEAKRNHYESIELRFPEGVELSHAELTQYRKRCTKFLLSFSTYRRFNPETFGTLQYKKFMERSLAAEAAANEVSTGSCRYLLDRIAADEMIGKFQKIKRRTSGLGFRLAVVEVLGQIEEETQALGRIVQTEQCFQALDAVLDQDMREQYRGMDANQKTEWIVKQPGL